MSNIETRSVISIDPIPGKPGWKRIAINDVNFVDFPPRVCGYLAHRLVDGDLSLVVKSPPMKLETE